MTLKPRAGILLLALTATACSPEQKADSGKSDDIDNVAAPISPPEQKIAEERTGDKAAIKDFSECRDLDGAPCREFLTDEDIAEADRILESKSAPSLCWEGYCPCEPPQGGPDQLLCDQMRRGEGDPELLSVGKSMREVRGQISEYDPQ